MASDELLVRHAAPVLSCMLTSATSRVSGLRNCALLEELFAARRWIHDLQHRLPALLDRLDHPVGRIELVRDDSLFSPSNFFLSRAISDTPC